MKSKVLKLFLKVIYFIFKLQAKDQGKAEAGELYTKLEKVCFSSVTGVR